MEIKQAVLELIELLDDIDDDVRSASIWSLSQIGGEGVRHSLERLLEQVEEYDEINLLEAALDNLAFTEDLELYTLFDFPGEEFNGDVSNFDVLETDEEFPYMNALNDDEEEFGD